MRLWTASFTRSEKGPLEPLIHTARDMGHEVLALDLSQCPDKDRLAVIEEHLNETGPDYVLAFFDRPEMVPVAYAAYHMGFPIAQAFAGDIAGGAWDDADRFVISNYATFLFTADTPQFKRCVQAMKWKKAVETPCLIKTVGATHFDDMEALTPSVNEPYDLVLYNPPSLLSRLAVEAELSEMVSYLSEDRLVYWATPNGDPNSDLVQEYANTFSPLPELCREEFLGYLKGATTLYGNSSCMFYEAPYFGIPVMQFGVRNRFRERISPERRKPGATKAILDVLERAMGAMG